VEEGEEEVGLLVVGSPLVRASDEQLWSSSGKNGVGANQPRLLGQMLLQREGREPEQVPVCFQKGSYCPSSD
jgi:hypothetical protein